MFQQLFLKKMEEFDLIFQNGTSSWGGTRKLPYAFTEHGVAMLAGLQKQLSGIMEQWIEATSLLL